MTSAGHGKAGRVGRPSRRYTDHLIDAATGAAPAPELADDRRSKKRHRYEALAALVLLSPRGERSPTMVVKTRDISVGGICVVTRQMIHPGSDGALQLVRSDGRAGLVGVKVRYCRYAGRMEHHSGLEFVSLPEGLSTEDFLDKTGQMPLLDPRLAEGGSGEKSR